MVQSSSDTAGMERTVSDTIETLLASVQEQLDDPDLRYKLRTARQLNVVCKDQLSTYRNSLDDAVLDDETRERLENLGYL